MACGWCVFRCALAALSLIKESSAPPRGERCRFHQALSNAESGGPTINHPIHFLAWRGAKAVAYLKCFVHLIKRVCMAVLVASAYLAASALLWLRAIPAILRNALGLRAAKPKSVLHVSYISHKQYMLSRLLRAHGVDSAYLAINTTANDRLNIGYDYTIPMATNPMRRLWMGIKLFWTVVARYDVIHYHFNAFILGNGIELPVLKAMGRVVVFHYRGCDVRQRSANLEKNPDLNICQECDYPEGSCDTDYQRNRMARTRRYGSLFFVTTPDMLDFFPTAVHMPFIAPYGMDLDGVEPLARTPGLLRVVTSSNHPGIDGVSYIKVAISRLQSEGVPVELVEVIKQPYREALAIYKSADLFCGKLRMGYYNNANIETMMMGVANMCYIRPCFMDNIPDCPIIVATPDTVYDRLKEWLSKPELLRDRGRVGPDFVKAHHDPDTVIQHMLNIYGQAWAMRK